MALLALCAWPPRTLEPFSGLDGGWVTGLQLAQVDELDWGREVLYTYGPLGFISVPQVWSLASLVGGLLYAGAAVALITFVPYYILSRQASRGAAFAVAAALVLVAPTQFSLPEILSLGALLLAIGVFQGALVLHLTPLAGLLGALAGIQALVKPPTAAVAVLACVLVVLAPRSGVLRRCGASAAGLLATFVVGWLGAAQSLLDLPVWIASELDLVRHFSEAMSVTALDRSYELTAAVLLVAGLLGYAMRFGVRMSRQSTIVFVAVVGFALWINAKQSFVRHDAHAALFFFVVPALAAAVLTRPASMRPLAVLVASSAVLTTVATGSTLAAEVDPGPSLRSFLSQVTYIVQPGRRTAASDAASARMRAAYAIPDSVLTTLSERTVHIDPYETSIVWAYHLAWRPVPVFQSHQAYSARSDSSNALALDTDGRAPESVLRVDSPPVDGRNSLWDTPRYMLSLLCRYRQTVASPPWQVLERVENRCGPMRAGTTTRFEANETVTVPRAGDRDVVVVSLDLDEPIGARFRTLLFRPKSPILVNVDGTNYRVPTSEVAGPLLLRIPRAVGWASQFGGASSYDSLSVNRGGSATFAIVPLV